MIFFQPVLPLRSLETLKGTRTKALTGSCSTLDGYDDLNPHFSRIGHSFRVMFWAHTGPGSLPFGRCRWCPIWLVIVKLFGGISGGVKFLSWQITLTGLIIVFSNFLTMLYYDPSILWKNKARQVLHIGCISRMSNPLLKSLLGLNPVNQSSPRWAIGLFLYQNLDAIDGYTFV